MLLAAFTPTQSLVVILAAFAFFAWIAWVYQAKREIPPLPPHAPKPVLRKCFTCKHFDQPAGQEAMNQWPAFRQATRFRTPAQMYNNAEHPEAVPPTAKWSDFGACEVHAEVRFSGDVCDRYEPKEPT